MKVLVLGADGFIGRHIAFWLRAAGHAVIAAARRTKPLENMGFRTLSADLTDPRTHDPDFWRAALRGGTHLINAAGLLTGAERAFAAVHLHAPAAAYAALDGGRAVLISAVGIDQAETPFARWRRKGEEAALAQGAVAILRPGLVLADTSYGGSSLLRALAALPFRTPVVGDGRQLFNPMHADDLAALCLACLTDPPGPGPWDAGGPERITQTGLICQYRSWLGGRKQRVVHLPLPLARTLGRAGDLLRLGPVSAAAVEQLQAGVLSLPAPLASHTGLAARGVTQFLTARPAGTQDLWQARLFLLKPAIRLTLAVTWLVSGLIGLFLPGRAFLPLLGPSPIGDATLTVMARTGGLIDLTLAVALLRNWAPVRTGLIQLGTVLAYTASLTLLAPAEWLAPFGGILKNLPVLALILTHVALAEER